MRLYLVRHGQTNRNQHPEFIGQAPDEPLTELGLKQARKLGDWLSTNKVEFKAVYCSPYKRALDTCHLALPKHPNITVVEELREYSTGDAENKKRHEMITEEILDEMMELGMHFKWPKGESLFEVEQRSAKWFHTMLQKHKHDIDNIAIFSHGMTIKCLLHFIMQFDHKLTWRTTLDNTSMSILDFKLDHWFLKSINTTPHLTQGEI